MTSNYTTLPISVMTGSYDDARAALAFFQTGQNAPVSVCISDDEIRVYLDDYRISRTFDGDEVDGREVWVARYGGDYAEGPLDQFDAVSLGVDQEIIDDLHEAIEEAMAALGGFAYSAAAAAMDRVSFHHRDHLQHVHVSVEQELDGTMETAP